MSIQEILFIVFNVFVISLCWALGMYVLATGMLGRKHKIKVGLIYSAIFYPIQLTMNFLFILVIDYQILLWDVCLFLLQAMLLALLLSHVYHERLVKTLSAVALSHFASYTFYAVFEAFVFEIMPDIKQLGMLKAMLLLNIFPHFVMLCFAIGMAFLLKKMNFHTYFTYLFRTRKRSLATMVGCLFSMNFYVLLQGALPQTAKPEEYAIIALVVIFIALFLLQFVAMFVAGQEQIRIQEETIIQQQAHVQLLEELQMELRTFRHDYQNLLSGIALQVEEGDLKGIEEFLQSTTGYFDRKLGDEIKQMGQLSRIKIYPVRSLLSIKLSELYRQGIQVDLEVMLPVTRLGIETEDFIRCLGILVDNAAEAVVEQDAGVVRVIFLQETEELRVAVTNTCVVKPEIYKIKTTGYTTKGAGRGTGLASYKRIVDGYVNCVTRTFWDNGFFTQELRIMLTGT